MPVIDFQTSAVPDSTAVTIARVLTASPSEYVAHIQRNREFAQFIWTCFYHLIEDVGYVPQPTGNGAKEIVCFVPLGAVNDPIISSGAIESLTLALRSVMWQAEVEQRGKKLYYKLKGVLSAADVPVLDKRCILPSPVQFSHLMRPENEAFTRLIWAFGDNVLRRKRTYNLGANPGLWLTQDVLEKGMSVYTSRGWHVQLWNAFVSGRKTHCLNFTLPPQSALPAPGKAS